MSHTLNDGDLYYPSNNPAYNHPLPEHSYGMNSPPKQGNLQEILPHEKEVMQKIENALRNRQLNTINAFLFFDMENAGILSPSHIRQVLTNRLNLSLSEEEIQILINKCDLAQGGITKQIFCELFSNLDQNIMSPDEFEQWKDSVLNRVRERIQEKNLSIWQTFEAFDSNKDGIISASEFKETFRIMRLGLRDDEIDKIYTYFDPRGIGMIDYRTFCDIIHQRYLIPVEFNPASIFIRVGNIIKDSQVTLVHAFRVFDENRDNQISMQEFFKVFQKMNMGLNLKEIECLWDYLPKNPRGYLDYQGFCDAMEGNFDHRSYISHNANNRVYVDPNPMPPLSILREHIQSQLQYKGTTIGAYFRAFDHDINGQLSIEEFRAALRHLKLDLKTQDIEALVEAADLNKDGMISLHEFIEFIQPTGNSINVFRRMMKTSGISPYDMFQMFDINRDGVVSIEEFKKICSGFKLAATSLEIEQIFNEIDRNRDCLISYNEFLDVMSNQAYIPQSPEKGKPRGRTPQRSNILEVVVKAITSSGISLYDAFKVFDTDNDGFISKQEFARVFHQMKFDISEDEIEALLSIVDTSGDDRISYNEFLELFRKYDTSFDSQAYTRNSQRNVPALFKAMDQYMEAHGMPFIKVYTQIFDRNKDCWISKDETVKGFNKMLDYPLSSVESNELIRELFPQGQAKIDYDSLKRAYHNYCQ
mmetsp:Transcript_4607/g.4477  ORF Transcript_4607/g.4477 Transcript_4607/m.4477 type:complete len:702 (-) Transcript_4607:22-2127(-)